MSSRLGFFGSPQRDDGLYIHVELDRSHEVIKLRVDVNNDLTQEFAPGSSHDTPTHYVCAKQVMGQKTFRPARVWLEFDSRRQLIESKVEGGRLLSEDEVENLADAGGAAGGN